MAWKSSKDSLITYLTMKSTIAATLLAGASAHSMFQHTEAVQGHDFTVSDLKSGNFTIASVDMVPGHSWQSWNAGTTSIVNVKGTTTKKILAGTFKWQLYETGVTSFLASGNSPYFTCDNKGCDPTSGIALKWKEGTTGDFDLSLTLALPQKASGGTNDFRLLIWGEDQDHAPYDFSATVDFSYATMDVNRLMQGKSVKNTLKAAQLQVHHAPQTRAGDSAHCMEMTISDPTANEYWEAHGYQYPIQLWPRGPCDRKKYNWFNRKTKIADGVTMITLGQHSNTKQVEAKLMTLQEAPAAADDCSDSKCLYLITNPTSPDGKQHCQELDNPNGTEGGYWKSKGWKYTQPPWKPGKCDRNLFNFVNRETQDLDGFKGVTFWYLGIQV